MIDIKDVKVGDTITIQATVTVTPTALATLTGDWIEITDHKPAIVLPTEPGWYIESRRDAGDPYNTLYALGGDGGWLTDGSLRWKPIDADRVPTDLVRLVPEGSEREQAFADAVRWLEDAGRFTLATDMRDYFEVQP